MSLPMLTYQFSPIRMALSTFPVRNSTPAFSAWRRISVSNWAPDMPGIPR